QLRALGGWNLRVGYRGALRGFEPIETHDLAAGANRGKQERGRGGEQENVGADGRLLEGAEEGVLAVLVELVRPVDDGDLPARHERLEREPAGELADLLDADVAPVAVAQDETDVGMAARRDPRAVRAHPARVVLPGIRAQQAGSEGVGNGPLTDTFRAEEEEAVG